MADAQISLEEAERFESACKEYAQRIESVVTFLKNSVARAGEGWGDNDYLTICDATADIEREVMAALMIAHEQIIPYVSRKVDVLKSK